jgi:hypothetical protein
MQHITVPLPDGIAPSVARRIAVEIEEVVSRRTGALVEAEITDLTLTDQERRVIRAAIDVAMEASAWFGAITLDRTVVTAELRHKVDPDNRDAVIAASLREAGEFHRESRA